jgi:hypothetical protein
MDGNKRKKPEEKYEYADKQKNTICYVSIKNCLFPGYN